MIDFKNMFNLSTLHYLDRKLKYQRVLEVMMITKKFSSFFNTKFLF